MPEGFQGVARANSICELDGQLRLAVARAEYPRVYRGAIVADLAHELSRLMP